MNLHDDLREVMGLLGKATYNNGCSSREISDAHLAAAKFLKDNGDEIRRSLDDAARYQWLRQERLPPAGETQPAAWISGRGNEHIESDWLTGDQADAAIDTARQHGPALLARQEGDGWLPIESAPEDGTVIWVIQQAWWGLWQYECKWEYGVWYHGYGDAWPAADPTHWRPLPAPPAARSGGGG